MRRRWGGGRVGASMHAEVLVSSAARRIRHAPDDWLRCVVCERRPLIGNQTKFCSGLCASRGAYRACHGLPQADSQQGVRRRYRVTWRRLRDGCDVQRLDRIGDWVTVTHVKDRAQALDICEALERDEHERLVQAALVAMEMT
jgi:hypothetical protein